MAEPDPVARRRAFCSAALAIAAWPVLGRAQATPLGYHGGRITPPVTVPDWPVRTADGRTTGLHALLAGRVTALQLFFTGCSATCPIQGAVFQRVQTLLGPHPRADAQLLSLSVDPLSDTPPRLSAWLARFDARPGWVAAAPALRDVDAVQRLFGGGLTGLDNHSTQVQVIDRDGRLIWRTYELPSAESVAAMLRA
jgi:protein SCO1